METKTKHFKINFENLKQYRNLTNQGLPIISMISMYNAVGIVSYLRGLGLTQVSPISCLYANAATLEKIHTFIINNWKRFNIEIYDNNRVMWDTTKTQHMRKRNRSLSPTITHSVNYDFLNYSPNLDDNIPDNEILFTMDNQEVVNTI